MKTPSFRHMGGKARLRNWLIEHFPKSGGFYVEPFVGKGNVFFASVQKLHFNAWMLADLDTQFLESLLLAELPQLPDTVTKSDFEDLKTRKDFISRILEPRITFGGKGYQAGFSGNSGTHIGYSKSNYLKVCEAARTLLKNPNVFICSLPWDKLVPGMNLTSNDFVYLDPPYFGTSAPYPNIDHQALVTTLNGSQFKWALSGYDNNLYQEQLKFANRFDIQRNSEIKASNKKQYSPVTETLWTNY